MNIVTTKPIVPARKLYKLICTASCALGYLITLSACTSIQDKPDQSDGDEFSAIPNSTDPKFRRIPVAPKGPRNFATDLVSAMGSSVGQCDEVAANTPHISWTCAEYSQGLGTFMKSWDKLEASAIFSKRQSYASTSDWMYFEIDGEIDFFWKTYDLVGTQALVTFDPSEKGSELIVGLNTTIGTNIAESPGSHKYSSASNLVPIQD